MLLLLISIALDVHSSFMVTTIGSKFLMVNYSVVTMTGICNSVGGIVFLTCYRSAGAGDDSKHGSVSRKGLLIGNRWMSQLRDRSGCPGMHQLLTTRNGWESLSSRVRTIPAITSILDTSILDSDRYRYSIPSTTTLVTS